MRAKVREWWARDYSERLLDMCFVILALSLLARLVPMPWKGGVVMVELVLLALQTVLFFKGRRGSR